MSVHICQKINQIKHLTQCQTRGEWPLTDNVLTTIIGSSRTGNDHLIGFISFYIYILKFQKYFFKKHASLFAFLIVQISCQLAPGKNSYQYHLPRSNIHKKLIFLHLYFHNTQYIITSQCLAHCFIVFKVGVRQAHNFEKKIEKNVGSPQL